MLPKIVIFKGLGSVKIKSRRHPADGCESMKGEGFERKAGIFEDEYNKIKNQKNHRTFPCTSDGTDAVAYDGTGR